LFTVEPQSSAVLPLDVGAARIRFQDSDAAQESLVYASTQIFSVCAAINPVKKKVLSANQR
jgi:hypothetical protein